MEDAKPSDDRTILSFPSAAGNALARYELHNTNGENLLEKVSRLEVNPIVVGADGVASNPLLRSNTKHLSVRPKVSGVSLRKLFDDALCAQTTSTKPESASYKIMQPILNASKQNKQNPFEAVLDTTVRMYLTGYNAKLNADSVYFDAQHGTLQLASAFTSKKEDTSPRQKIRPWRNEVEEHSVRVTHSLHDAKIQLKEIFREMQVTDQQRNMCGADSFVGPAKQVFTLRQMENLINDAADKLSTRYYYHSKPQPYDTTAKDKGFLDKVSFGLVNTTEAVGIQSPPHTLVEKLEQLNHIKQQTPQRG